MAFSTGGSSGVSAEINVTPLIDVLLVLLIIFMVIVPITPLGLAALLPQPPKGSPQATPERPVVVEVQSAPGGDVLYAINQQRVSKADLPQTLSHLLAGRQEKVMFVRGDRGLQFASIAEVIAQGHQASAERIGVLTPDVEAAR